MDVPSAEQRAQIMAALRQYARLQGPHYNRELSVINLTHQAKVDLNSVFQVVHELARIGVLIPGQGHYLALPIREIAGIRDAHEVYNWPDFAITPFGRDYLLNEANNILSGEAAEYIALLKTRMPDLPEVVEQYANEAKRAFDRGLWLAVSVLLGVAAEGLLEWLYESLGDHLEGDSKAKFDKVFAKTRNAQPHYDAFVKEMDGHFSEIPPDVLQRYKSLFDALVTIYKMNRDDVAHHRTTRIDQDTAMAALNSFPVLVQLVADLGGVLESACTMGIM